MPIGEDALANYAFQIEVDGVTLAQFKEVSGLSAEIQVVEHGISKTIKDARVDQSDGIIYAMCERPLAEIAFSAGRTIARVRRRDGAREVLGEWDLTPATP